MSVREKEGEWECERVIFEHKLDKKTKVVQHVESE